MPRIRTVKPEFWSSPKVAKVSRDARLLFIALWNEADDEGRLLGQTKRLAGIVFGFDDDVDAKQIEVWLAELNRAGLIVRYVSNDSWYISIPGFNDHQKIDRRQASRLPTPPPHAEQSEDSADLSADHADKKVLEQGKERNREQGNRKEERKRPAVPAAPPPEQKPETKWIVPEHLDTPEVRNLLDRYAAMRKRKREQITDFRDASMVLGRFDDVPHLVYALETCIANEYQGLKPDYRPNRQSIAASPPARNGKAPLKTFAEQREENTDRAFGEVFKEEGTANG